VKAHSFYTKNTEGANMSELIIVAVISFVGTALGTLGGIITSNRLTLYRIEQLEKKVDKHNNLIERTFQLEKRCDVSDEKIKVANNRIKDLEETK
jgi:hypothetical protein